MSAPRIRGDQVPAVLGAAGTMGFAADYLLWYGPAGPGFSAWLALLGTSAVVLVRRSDLDWRRSTAFWSAVAVIASVVPVVRSSPELGMLCFLTLILAASMVMVRARGRAFGRTRVLDHVRGVALVPLLAALGSLQLLLRADLVPAHPDRRRAVALGRGVLLAIPPVVVFAALFASADPVFARYAERLAGFWSDELPVHLVLVLAFGWIAGGLLTGVLPGSPRNPLARLRPPRVGTEETAVVLGFVATLFAVFVAIQLPYLFGGRATIESTTGLTLAEYARRGFFELVTVAALVLALLLLAGAVAPRGAGRWVFRSLSLVLVVEVLVVIASAALRLHLYVDEFGLTTSRLYGAAFMLWLTATLSWFGATTARDRPRRFASGAVVAWLVGAAALAAVNPDALIARTNLDRSDAQPVDGRYLAHLSADAVPVLLAGLDDLPAPQSCTVGRILLERWTATGEPRPGDGDWRRWNAASSRARARVRDLAPDLRATLARCPEPRAASAALSAIR